MKRRRNSSLVKRTIGSGDFSASVRWEKGGGYAVILTTPYGVWVTWAHDEATASRAAREGLRGAHKAHSAGEQWWTPTKRWRRANPGVSPGKHHAKRRGQRRSNVKPSKRSLAARPDRYASRPDTWTVIVVNEALQSGHAVGTFGTPEAADAYAQDQAARSRSFSTYQVAKGTPKEWYTKIGPVYRGRH